MDGQKTRFLVAVACSALLAVPGCSKSKVELKVSTDSSAIRTPVYLDGEYITVSLDADVETDFQQAIQQGDTRFVGVMGFALEVPGVSDLDERLRQANGVKIIRGTSDSYPDSSSLARQIEWTEYAQRYNTLMLTFIRSTISD